MTTLTIIAAFLITLIAVIYYMHCRLKTVTAELEEVKGERDRKAQFERDMRDGKVWAHPQVPRRDLSGSRYMHTYMMACGSPGTYGGTRNMETEEFGQWLAQMDEGEKTGLYKLQQLQRKFCEQYVKELDLLQAEARCRKAEAKAAAAQREANKAKHSYECMAKKV